MADEIMEMPCPACPEGCPKHNPMCRPLLQDMEGVAEGTQAAPPEDHRGGRLPQRPAQEGLRETYEKGAEMVKGKHWICCVRNFPECPCVTCAKDNQGEAEEPCCDQHSIFCAPCAKCSDYVKEERADV